MAVGHVVDELVYGPAAFAITLFQRFGGGVLDQYFHTSGEVSDYCNCFFYHCFIDAFRHLKLADGEPWVLHPAGVFLKNRI